MEPPAGAEFGAFFDALFLCRVASSSDEDDEDESEGDLMRSEWRRRGRESEGDDSVLLMDGVGGSTDGETGRDVCFGMVLRGDVRCVFMTAAPQPRPPRCKRLTSGSATTPVVRARDQCAARTTCAESRGLLHPE